MSDRLRVVIDTNLVLSALVFGGSTARLRLAWQSDRKSPKSPTLKFFVRLRKRNAYTSPKKRRGLAFAPPSYTLHRNLNLQMLNPFRFYR
jgi:hypothetical protein